MNIENRNSVKCTYAIATYVWGRVREMKTPRRVKVKIDRVNSKRALEQMRNKDEKVPLFCDEPPHFFEKDVAFSQRVLGRYDKVQCLFTKFCTKRKAGQRNSLHFVGTSTKIPYFCRKTFAVAATLCRPFPPI